MNEMTTRFDLPLLVAGQGQKDITHNEALLLIDMLLHPSVESRALASPPANPTGGQCWLIPTGATGAWEGSTDAMAAWTAGGWRFIPAREGMTLWVRDEQLSCRYFAGQWNII